MINSVDMFGSAQTGTGYSTPIEPPKRQKKFTAIGSTSSGSGACVVKIWSSPVPAASVVTANDTQWKELGSITLTLGTTVTNDSFQVDSVNKTIRAEVDSISGTGASVNVYLEIEA